jgi:hypothetical protein
VRGITVRGSNRNVTVPSEHRRIVPQYTLVIELGAAGLRHSAERRLRVVVAKPSGASKPNVAWLAREPAERTTISWDDTYGLYAAVVPERDGLPLSVVAAVYPALDGAIHPFVGTAFGDPVSEGRIPRGHYDVRNDEDELAMTFGLLQTATVDGQRSTPVPLNAVNVPAGFTADFTAVTRVYVWAEADVGGGTVVSQMPPDATEVAFDAAHGARRCRYDVESGTFTVVDDASPPSSEPSAREKGDEP